MNSADNPASGTAAGSLCNQLHKADNNLCNQLHKPLGDRVAFYADAARSLATRRAYAADMTAFSAWGGQVPASPELVASYLAASDTLAASTLRRRLAAIADAHQAAGHSDPTKHSLVRKVFRGICRIHGLRADAATPLDADMLARIVAALPHDVTAIRDRALLLLGSSAPSGGPSSCPLRWRIWIDGQTAGLSRSSGARPTPMAEANAYRCRRSMDPYLRRLPWRIG